MKKKLNKLMCVLGVLIVCISTASAEVFTATVPHFGGWSTLSSTQYKGGSHHSGYMVTSTFTVLKLYGEFDKYVNNELRRVSHDIYRINYSENFSYWSRTDVPYTNSYLQGSFYCGMRAKTSALEPNNINIAVSWGAHW